MHHVFGSEIHPHIVRIFRLPYVCRCGKEGATDGGHPDVRHSWHMPLEDDWRMSHCIGERLLFRLQPPCLPPGLWQSNELLVDHLPGMPAPEGACLLDIIRDQSRWNLQPDLLCERKLVGLVRCYSVARWDIDPISTERLIQPLKGSC